MKNETKKMTMGDILMAIALAGDEYCQKHHLNDEDSRVMMEAFADVSFRAAEHLTGYKPFSEKQLESAVKAQELAAQEFFENLEAQE